MDCKQARKLIIDSLYGELSSESITELEEHIANCRDCSAYKEEIQHTLECLDQGKEVQVSMDLVSLHNAVRRKRQNAWQFLRPRWVVWGSAVTGLLGIVFSIFSLLASEVQYKDNTLIIKFGKTPDEQSLHPEENLLVEMDSLSKKTARVLENYRKDQLRFQEELNEKLRDSEIRLSQMINEYESLRDKQLTEAFQQLQIQHYQSLIAIRGSLEALASQTENEFRRSYLTMSTMAGLISPQ